MNLVKEHWAKKDIAEFQEYLKSFSRPEKIQWTKNIINTELPCLAVLSPNIKQIVKEIAKGNFIEFLNLNICEYYENTAINASLLAYIKDFELFEKQLYKVCENADNWATCDTISFKIKKGNEKQYLNLAKKYVKSCKTFVRRVGVDILFSFINTVYLDEVFKIISGLESEQEYYVNMCVAWLIAECFTKQRERTLEFLKQNKLNKFTINKAVSKCRDSFRITEEDKKMLLQFKK